MFRRDFQRLAKMRLREARRLLEAEQWCGAYYLTGLAVECAIKACISKLAKRHQFPDLEKARESWQHDPAKLIKAAHLSQELSIEQATSQAFDANWSLAKDWSVEDRYSHSTTREKAKDLYRAVTTRNHGVFGWLRQHW